MIDESNDSYNDQPPQMKFKDKINIYRSVFSQKTVQDAKSDLRKRPFTDIENSGSDDDLTILEKGTENLVLPSTSTPHN